MPAVSVIMSVFDGERYLRESINSILTQTFQDFEFIIIDDGSHDNTPGILASVNDDRIKVIRNDQNSGLAVALNEALSIAGAGFIARQDADDISFPERLERQVSFLHAHPNAGVVAVTTEWIDKEGEKISVWRQPVDNLDIQETLMQYCCLIHGSTMMRKEAVNEVQGYNAGMRTGQDYDLWLRIAETWDIYSLPEILYAHRRHEGMVSLVESDEQKKNASEALQQAVQRRIRYSSQLLRRDDSKLPDRLRSMERSATAERFVCWSAGMRQMNRTTAFRFLLTALSIAPFNRHAWRYVSGILSRKLRLDRRIAKNPLVDS